MHHYPCRLRVETAVPLKKFIIGQRWKMAPSAVVESSGEAISFPNFKDKDWKAALVPGTVLGGLVAAGEALDPNVGLNLKSVDGYREGPWLAMEPSSPFYSSWWFRTEFTIPEGFDWRFVSLLLEGINYRANVWLDGEQVGKAEDLVGMFRRFEIPLSGSYQSGTLHALAVEIVAPGKIPVKAYKTKQLEATTGWDDHNPVPPDLNMGIWRPIALIAHGPVRMRNPYVLVDLDEEEFESANLTLCAELENRSSEAQVAVLKGTLEGDSFSTSVVLPPGGRSEVRIGASEAPALALKEPRLWWPINLGKPELYQMDCQVEVDGELCDEGSVRFGVRSITSVINDDGWREFHVNGRRCLVRGSVMMTQDLLLRFSRERTETLLRYAAEAGFNMLRVEGFSVRESDLFYDVCDRMGIMVTQQLFGRSIEDEELAIACVEDTLLRLRNHPSLVHLLGHDESMPSDSLDVAYRTLVHRLTPTLSYQSDSGAFLVGNRKATGGTRTGTRDLWTYAGPAEYYLQKKYGAWGFAQSGGIGGTVSSLDTIRQTVHEAERWPLFSESMSFHTVLQGASYFKKFMKAMERRFWKPESLEEFVQVGSAMNYESARAMLEAFGQNKYEATGITAWKFNTAWATTLSWQFVDYYLRPTGAYYGAKRALEPVHVQYSYGNRSVWVVNSTRHPFDGVTVDVKMFDFDMNPLLTRSQTVPLKADDSVPVMVLPSFKEAQGGVFLWLAAKNLAGKRLSRNFYWLSRVPPRPAPKVHGMFPVWFERHGNLKALRRLPRPSVDINPVAEYRSAGLAGRIAIENVGTHPALFLRFALLDPKTNMEMSGVHWSDNFVSAIPREHLTIRFRVFHWNQDAPIRIKVSGLNLEDRVVMVESFDF